jgi:hypothetical protein
VKASGKPVEEMAAGVAAQVLAEEVEVVAVVALQHHHHPVIRVRNLHRVYRMVL